RDAQGPAARSAGRTDRATADRPVWRALGAREAVQARQVRRRRGRRCDHRAAARTVRLVSPVLRACRMPNACTTVQRGYALQSLISTAHFEAEGVGFASPHA